ncbi:hypothetical protein KAR91_13815 [Candidatus Pacearchaeota archaeon]|nr:hypothetical protein [Candidatus Pacearchaeota archaeon]
MSETSKLYLISLKNMSEYNHHYVIANDPTSAYKKVREYLDEKDLCFPHEREMDSVKLMAEEAEYPDCKTRLFIC